MKGHSDRLVEWLSSIVLIGWALVLMQPGDTLRGTSFAEFLRYGVSEEAIAGSFALVGGLRVAALFINGRWPRTPLIRMAGAGGTRSGAAAANRTPPPDPLFPLGGAQIAASGDMRAQTEAMLKLAHSIDRAADKIAGHRLSAIEEALERLQHREP
jgi:hypothetical protein